MKMILRLAKEAIRYKKLYFLAIFSTFMLTAINLAAPKILSKMTGVFKYKKVIFKMALYKKLSSAQKF